MTHLEVANFAETWGLLFLFGMFVTAIIYALWPANNETFSEAANRPLDDE